MTTDTDVTDTDREQQALLELSAALTCFRNGVVQTHTETLAALDGIHDVVKLLADTRVTRIPVAGKATAPVPPSPAEPIAGTNEGGRFDRYRHQVLEVAQRLAEHASGTGAVLQADEARYLTAWLTWRVGPGGWVPTSEALRGREYSPQNAYDDTVRQLAQAALALVRHHEGSR